MLPFGQQERKSMSNVIITIARQYGSGGKTVGKMLAKELDIP